MSFFIKNKYPLFKATFIIYFLTIITFLILSKNFNIFEENFYLFFILFFAFFGLELSFLISYVLLFSFLITMAYLFSDTFLFLFHSSSLIKPFSFFILTFFTFFSIIFSEIIKFWLYSKQKQTLKNKKKLKDKILIYVFNFISLHLFISAFLISFLTSQVLPSQNSLIEINVETKIIKSGKTSDSDSYDILVKSNNKESYNYRGNINYLTIVNEHNNIYHFTTPNGYVDFMAVCNLDMNCITIERIIERYKL